MQWSRCDRSLVANKYDIIKKVPSLSSSTIVFVFNGRHSTGVPTSGTVPKSEEITLIATIAIREVSQVAHVGSSETTMVYVGGLFESTAPESLAYRVAV